jgi:serine/threonine protein kinase
MNTLVDFLKLEKFHDGSNNQIYRAVRATDQTPVVLKMPRSEYPTNRELARLHNEYYLLAQLHTPGIVRVYGLEKFGRSIALVMESLDGESLQTVLGQRQLTISECLTLAIKIASLLSDVHAQQIVHRDI